MTQYVPEPTSTDHAGHSSSVPIASVLWIDDQVSPSDAAVRLLELGGFLVHCATSVREGLLRLQNTRYDGIILDLRLPDGPGLSVLEALPRVSHRPPVLVLTGYGDFESARIAGRFGAFRFEGKPLPADALGQLLRDMIRSAALAPEPAIEHLVLLGRTQSIRDVVAADMESGLEPACRTLDTAPLSRLVGTTLLTAELSSRSFLKCAALFRAILGGSAPELPELRRVLQDITSQCVPQDPAPPNARVAEAIERLEKAARPHSIREGSVAADLFVDPGHLARSFRAETGLHFREWRSAVAMRRAVRRIAHESTPISEISWDVGFEHLSAFDREFLRVLGLSPTEFRQMYRRWGTDNV